MSERRCEGCRWWRYDADYHGKPHGVCRRHSPVNGEFPEVFGDNTCGEWSDKNITPEQAERRELVRRFAVAITEGWYASANRLPENQFVWPEEEPWRVWEQAEVIVEWEGRKEGDSPEGQQ